MKKVLTNILAVSALIVLVGCGDKSQTSEPGSSIISSEPSLESSSIEESSSSSSKENTSVSSEKSSTAPSSSSSKSSSSSSASSSNPGYKENELSTTDGLKIKFKATGASIDTVTYGSTQIAKDGFVVGRCANRIANGMLR